MVFIRGSNDLCPIATINLIIKKGETINKYNEYILN